jgi:quinol monooxygenase YgiN
MWGLIAKITLVPGKRDEMIEILKQSAADMPGCISYVVAKDTADESSIWVTEVWDSQASHDASLSLPAVKDAIPRGKAIVSSFERIAVTIPVCGELVCQWLTLTDSQTAPGTHIYLVVKTMRGFPGACHVSAITESGTIFVAIWSFAGTAASKTLRIAPSSFGKGTLFTPEPIN